MDSLRLEVARDAVMTFLTESLPVLLDGEIRDALIAVSSLFPGAVALTAVWARRQGGGRRPGRSSGSSRCAGGRTSTVTTRPASPLWSVGIGTFG